MTDQTLTSQENIQSANYGDSSSVVNNDPSSTQLVNNNETSVKYFVTYAKKFSNETGVNCKNVYIFVKFKNISRYCYKSENELTGFSKINRNIDVGMT